MASNQRIPVSEETRDAIRQLKPPGQTYDEFLQEFIEQKRREQLAADVKSVFERADDPAAVVDALNEGEFDHALELMGLTREDADALTEMWQEEADELRDDTDVEEERVVDENGMLRHPENSSDDSQ